MKYKKFNEVITNMLEKLLPIKRTQIRQSDKPWMTPSLKCSITKRQRMLHKYGKSSVMFGIIKSSLTLSQPDLNIISKLKDSNPSKWWKEVKSIGGLSCSNSWHHQLLSLRIPLVKI